MARDKTEILKELKVLRSEEIKLQEKSVALTKEEIKLVDELKKKKKELVKELRTAQQDRLDAISSEESSIKSMGSMYQSLSNTQKKNLQVVSKAKNKNNLYDESTVKTITNIQRINRDIAALGVGDVQQKAALTNEYKDQMGQLDGRAKGLGDIKNDLKTQNSLAGDYTNMSSEQKDLIQSQHDVLEGIKKTIQGTIMTVKTLYGNTQGFIGGLITGFGVVVSKIGKANMELGTSMSQTDGVARSAGVLSFIFDDAVQSARDLSSELGGTDKATFGLQANVGLMATNMGISGTEASKLIGSFSRLNGNSTDVASDMVKTSQEFAKQNNIIPAQLMSDLANSTEEFALFGKAGGENILRAAGYATKLGVSMSTMGGIAEGLLDFESSITKELELGAMLGKNINLSKARELAYSDDIEGAVKETMKQLGGVAAFNKMDYYQKKQTADLLGVSVGELKKMNSNMESAGKLSGVVSQTFSKWGESMSAVTNKYLGVGLSTMGGWITASAQVGSNFANMGLNLGGILKGMGGAVKSAYNWVKQLIIGNALTKAQKTMSDGQIGAGFAGKKAKDMLAAKASGAKGSIAEKITGSVKGGKSPIGGKGSITQSLGKIKMSSVLKGAAALVIVAAAVWVFGKAVQEFMKVSWSAVGMAVVSMLALVGAVALLGAIMMSGVGAVAILAGAAAMLVVAAAVLVLGLGLQAIGTGFEMLGAGISSLMPTLATVSSSIMGMVTMIAPIALLSYALLGLSASLMGLGIAMAFLGIAGLPGLMMLAGIAAVSTPIIKLAEFFGLGSSDETGGLEEGSLSTYETNMLSKMDQLIVATTGQRDIYLDKDKVTNIVMDRGERSAVNKFKLNRA